jgi:hypothetical protein
MAQTEIVTAIPSITAILGFLSFVFFVFFIHVWGFDYLLDRNVR